MKLPDFGEILERERSSFTNARQERAEASTRAAKAQRAIQEKQRKKENESEDILAVVNAERNMAFAALKSAGVSPPDSVKIPRREWFPTVGMSEMRFREVKGWNMVTHSWETPYSEDGNTWMNSNSFTLMMSTKGVIYQTSEHAPARPIELRAHEPFARAGGAALGIDFVRQGLAHLIVVAENADRR